MVNKKGNKDEIVKVLSRMDESSDIEQILYDAQKSLPTTDLEWRISDMTEKKKEYKKYPVLRKVAVCMAVVLLLGVGGVTVVANMEMNVGEGEYGIWVETISESWNDCKLELKSRGITLPKAFEVCKFGNYDTGLVVKQGTTYMDAFQDKVYHPLSVNYYEGVPGEGGKFISVYIGTLDEVYWNAYFEFDFIEGVWIPEEVENTLDYEGMTLYGKQVHYESGDKMNWKWIDEANGVVVSVYADEDIDSIEVVKTIIDMNK